MRMSADDDDQADQKHELADPGMVETEHSVLETPLPQLCSRRVVVSSDDKYLSTKVLKYVLKYFFGTYLLVLKYFRKLVLSTYT